METALDLSWSDRVQVQRGLAHVGFDPGPADGVFGRRIRGAIASYQRDKGLPATGYLTAELGDALIALGGAAQREDEAYTLALAAGTEESWASYLSSYPAGRHAVEARRERDRLRAEAAARREAEGRRAAEAARVARERDDAAYERARAAGTEESWTSYLSSYPGGRHAVEARREQDRLRAEAAAAAARRAATRRALEAARREIRRLSDDPARRPGSVFRDCADCPEMVVVPAGSFMMGSRFWQEGRSDIERPRHRVTISAPFAVGVYAVTFSDWDACVSDGGCGGYRPGDRGWGRGSRPVIYVSWNDAQAYVRWLSGKTGKSYRLLSESEWEYVARAGTTTPFHTGATISTDQANYNGNFTYGSGRKGESRERTMPVGSFAANAWGLHDVHGNVCEWTEDCWNASYVGAPDDGGAWTRGDCSRRVLRGGSWSYFPRNACSAARSSNVTGVRYWNTGFRVARTFVS